MKNWKRWLAAGCMAALLGIGTMGTTAMAMGGGGVDRSDAVAEEDELRKFPVEKQHRIPQPVPKHGRKSTVFAIMEAGRSWKEQLQEASMFPNGRTPLTGVR